MNMAGYRDVIVGREKEREKIDGKKMVWVVGSQTMYVRILLT